MSALCRYFHECSGERGDSPNAILMRRRHARDELAFRSFVEHYQSAMFAFTYAVTADETEADELAQRVFARACVRAKRFAPTIPVSTWLYRIAFYECVRWSRLRTLRKLAKAFHSLLHRRTTMPPGPPPNSHEAGRRYPILAALKSLSPRKRVLLALREVGDQSISDLSHITGDDPKAVRSELFAARRKLLKAVQRLEAKGN